MSISKKILNELESYSKTKKICKQEKYTTATAKFDVTSFKEVLDTINRVIDPVVENGEKIVCNIDRGEIIDSKIKGFEIEKGVLIELYDYASTTVAFIRLYHIKDAKKEWLALYIDENPDTPWWTNKERND